MNILIFSGGTGSVAIQTGLHTLYGDNINVRVITNTQDNGKSTGIVRKVLDGKINGPSDLRKNQVLRYKLQGGNSNLINFLNERFDCASQDAERHCLDLIWNLSKKDASIEPSVLDTMAEAVKKYFTFPLSTQVTYTDFSIANIIYAGLAAPTMSLAEAGRLMAKNVLNIPEDSVIVADDNSLFLQARTQSGRVILDEGDIVDWNNSEDKIVETFFTDNFGREVNAKLSIEALMAINSADIIIFSSGTQWSSLIPTYQHYLFPQAIDQAPARKYLVVNNTQDKDMKGVTASDMLELLGNKYLPLDSITCIFNESADVTMQVDESFMNERDWRFIVEELSDVSNKTHDGKKIAKLIMFDFYGDVLKNDAFIFDYDDTIMGRNSTYSSASNANKRMILDLANNIKTKLFSICTGNSIKALNFNENVSWDADFSMVVFAECGVNEYTLTINSQEISVSPPRIVDHSYIFSQESIDEITTVLEEIGINFSKIQNRNNAIISIKPVDVDYRKPLAILIGMLFPELTVRESGRTTIDISLGASKDIILERIFHELGDPHTKITVIGDEADEDGNDFALAINPFVDFVIVKNPKDTYVFLTTLNLFFQKTNLYERN
jgi:2-phospho-L-lactate transferase/gluconeogenesis factor (CofD/UPF0052 family)